VLLHGLFATTSMNWPYAFDALSPHFRVLALDHRGHGRGIKTYRQFRLEDCADDVVALADALGIGQVIPVGYSMGGPVALLARKRHRHRVAGMVLCATSAVFGSEAEESSSGLADMFGVALRLTPPVVRQSMMRAVISASRDRGYLPAGFADEARHHDPAAMVEARRAVARFDARPWVESLGGPAAVVLTARDRLVPAERQMALARATRASVHQVDADHDVAVRHPRRFLPALVDACRAVARQASTAMPA